MENSLLKVLLTIMMIAFLAETLFVLYASNRVRTLVVPSHIDRKFFIEGDNASPEYVEMMSKYAVELVSSYTPETVEGRTQEFLRFINPEYYSQVSTQMLAMATEAKKYSISQFYVFDRYSLKGNEIAISGILRKYVQDKPVDQKRTDFKMTFKIANGRFEVITYEKIEDNNSNS